MEIPYHLFLICKVKKIKKTCKIKIFDYTIIVKIYWYIDEQITFKAMQTSLTIYTSKYYNIKTKKVKSKSKKSIAKLKKMFIMEM